MKCKWCNKRLVEVAGPLQPTFCDSGCQEMYELANPNSGPMTTVEDEFETFLKDQGILKDDES